eukprot:scaffold1340_cov122-Cylindrotheca_fusiformis.AAC.15
MNNRLNNGIQHPRHPSLDNLRRGQLNGSQSHPQLTSVKDDGNHVRFESTDSYSDGPLEFIIDCVLAIIAVMTAFGMATILICLYLVVRPFSVPVARRLSAQLGASSWLDSLALLLPNVTIKLTGDSDVPSPVGTSILVSNHMMDGDWFSILMLGRCVGLRGTIKAFLRNDILHLKKQSSDRSLTRAYSAQARPSRATSQSGANGSPQRGSGTGVNSGRQLTSVDLSLAANFLHTFLEFPLLYGEDYISDRESMFQLLRSFADRNGAGAPVHLLLFPEGWSLYHGEDRKSVLARSNEFAKREGRPQLKHLLLPRTTGFNASLDSLRESSPVVYDVTIARRGYSGSPPPKSELSIISLYYMLRRKYPEEVHFRIKRYSMEEVLSDSSWLDKKWAEKDRLLHHFSRHQSFPADRGFCRYRVFESRTHSLETSIVSFFRLLILPCTIPLLMLLSIPILLTVVWVWLAYTTFKLLFPDPDDTEGQRRAATRAAEDAGETTASESNTGSTTPFLPATPFVSPMPNW